ncbi:MAG: hypothetical protein H6961_01405 [Chromatiaceae bacterium]|nr:hypothetical protein [Chromatiaceae bacterium]
MGHRRLVGVTITGCATGNVADAETAGGENRSPDLDFIRVDAAGLAGQYCNEDRNPVLDFRRKTNKQAQRTTNGGAMNKIVKFVFVGTMLLTVSACSDTKSTAATVDGRATMLVACNSKPGIGWLKKEYGDKYCDCWADQAKEILSPENYVTLLDATAAELKAADKAEREKIYRKHTEIYSTVSDAAGRCAKKARAAG